MTSKNEVSEFMVERLFNAHDIEKGVHKSNKPYTFSEDTVTQYGYFDTFHPKHVFMVERPDEYYCGMRAEHFVVNIGYWEASGQWSMEENNMVIIVVANYKGTLRHRSIVF